jgi:hypothetical protein
MRSMNQKIIITIILFNLLISSSFAQRATKDFDITIPEEKVSGAVYNKLELIDIREDTTDLGMVQLGAFNRKVWVVPERPLALQMQEVVSALGDVDALAGELLMVLRKFSFAEVTGAFSEKGYCQFRAALFAKKENGYSWLGAIDTVILVSSMDVTRPLFRNGSQVVINFIKANITKSSTEPRLVSYENAIAIDKMEKAGLMVYNTTFYQDGVYRTYQAFANQVPDEQNILVELSENKKIKSVKKETGKKKPELIQSKDVYAIVYEGKPYIATDYGFYPLQKRKEDFYFTGKAKVAADPAGVAMAAIFFGMMGSLMASSPGQAVFEMKIDHVSGGFIRLKEIKRER